MGPFHHCTVVQTAGEMVRWRHSRELKWWKQAGLVVSVLYLNQHVEQWFIHTFFRNLNRKYRELTQNFVFNAKMTIVLINLQNRFCNSGRWRRVWQARPISTEAGGHSLEKRILAADGGSDSFTLKTNIASGWVTGFTPRHTPTKHQTSSQSQIQIHAQAHVNNSLECINAVSFNEAVVDLPLLPFIRRKEAWDKGKMQCGVSMWVKIMTLSIH